VSRPEEIGANVLSAAEEIPGSFFLLAGTVNGGERAGAVENRELGRVAPIGLDAIAGAPRDERGRDHVTGDVVGRQGSLQFEAARAGFVAALHGAPAAHALDESQDRGAIRCQRVQCGRALARQ
jgi:hypothetical protein